MSDEVEGLARAAADGDRSAVEALLLRYLPELRAFVRLRTGPELRARESSSDLVQSVCREVLRHAARFEHGGESAFKHWLYATALRKVANRAEYWRAERRDAGREAPPDALGGGAGELLDCYRRFTTPGRRAELNEEVERVERAFDELDEEQRELVCLAHLVGLSRAEIAGRTGRTEGSVRVALHRALARLARALADLRD